MNRIDENLRRINEQIAEACLKTSRDERSVKLLLASKTVEPERIREAFQLGQTLFGENKAQELNQKIPFLQDLPIEWHFIGHLQSNKVKDVINSCQLIHSVDRLSLAKEINKQATKRNQRAKVLIEVNTSGEQTKSGLPPHQVMEFCHQVQEYNHIEVKGLMTIAINSSQKNKIRDCFKKLANLAEQIKSLNFPNQNMTELSMGMSSDFPIAIEEGATIIRLGSSVFGARS